MAIGALLDGIDIAMLPVHLQRLTTSAAAAGWAEDVAALPIQVANYGVTCNLIDVISWAFCASFQGRNKRGRQIRAFESSPFTR